MKHAPYHLPTKQDTITSPHPTSWRLASLLQASTRTQSRPRGRAIHAVIITSGLKPRAHLLNLLIAFYCSTEDLKCAHHVFDRMPQRDVVARTTLLAAHARSGALAVAHQIFDEMPTRDAVAYNAMISAYGHHGKFREALSLFRAMLEQGKPRPDGFTFTAALSACAGLEDQNLSSQVHCLALKAGLAHVTSVSNALISVYVKSGELGLASKMFTELLKRDEITWTTMITGFVRIGDLEGARRVFEVMRDRFDVAWNAMIAGYAQHGLCMEALDLFRDMFGKDIMLDEFTYTSLLSACANIGLVRTGMEAHAYIVHREAEISLPVWNAIISLYAKCGRMEVAMRVFDAMREKDLVSWNAVVSGYATLGMITEAREIFEKMIERNELTWTVMISGSAQHGQGEEGLRLFNRMRHEDSRPCDFAFAGALTACASLGTLRHGAQLHAQLIQLGLDASVSAGNALMTMYARCGAVESAERAFRVMPTPDAVSWNAMIAALGQHGRGSEAIMLFERMLVAGYKPDRVTFLTVLSSCSHSGLVNEGCKYFDLMDRAYGIKPGPDHYARLVDLLGRAGRLQEAKQTVETMPFYPDACIWEALLAGCRNHGDMELGLMAAERLFELRPRHDGTYVLLSNMYASIGKWEGVAKVRKTMKDMGVKKEPGCSWIEVDNQVHVFLVDDTVHPYVHEVYALLEKLGVSMKKLGYIPDTRFVLHDVGLEQKEYGLSTHSEKLAVGFGLLKLPKGSEIRVLKNLRICGDCHTAMKFMSKVVEREIIVRDGKRFHHFKHGECSCRDYW
ncbi:hypothetical protein AMTRI_Chr02g263690 [Amborella trichopoda]